MIPIGWFGLGSGVLADAEGVADVARTAEELGFDSVWVGEHPVLIDPHAPPSPLPSHSELMDPCPCSRTRPRSRHASRSAPAS